VAGKSPLVESTGALIMRLIAALFAKVLPDRKGVDGHGMRLIVEIDAAMRVISTPGRF
jgi:hypothetical protein